MADNISFNTIKQNLFIALGNAAKLAVTTAHGYEESALNNKWEFVAKNDIDIQARSYEFILLRSQVMYLLISIGLNKNQSKTATGFSLSYVQGAYRKEFSETEKYKQAQTHFQESVNYIFSKIQKLQS